MLIPTANNLEMVKDMQTLLLRSNMKSYMGFRLAYLHLTVCHSKGHKAPSSLHKTGNSYKCNYQLGLAIQHQVVWAWKSTRLMRVHAGNHEMGLFPVRDERNALSLEE